MRKTIVSLCIVLIVLEGVVTSTNSPSFSTSSPTPSPVTSTPSTSSSSTASPITSSPSAITPSPSGTPSSSPSSQSPSSVPTVLTPSPSSPTPTPTTPTPSPTPSPISAVPTFSPSTPSPSSASPTSSPSSAAPTLSPSTPSPSSAAPTLSPSTPSPNSAAPTLSPSTASPTSAAPTPSPITSAPTASKAPTLTPTLSPLSASNQSETIPPPTAESASPTIAPTKAPSTLTPTASPTTKAPTVETTSSPTSSSESTPAPTLSSNGNSTSYLVVPPTSVQAKNTGTAVSVLSMAFAAVIKLTQPETHLSSQFADMTIDLCQSIGMTALLSTGLDNAYRDLASQFLWSSGAFGNVGCAKSPVSDPVYGGVVERVGLKCISEFLIVLLIFLGLMLLFTVLRILLWFLAKPWCNCCVKQTQKERFLKRIKWIHIGAIVREHSLLAYALAFTATLEIIKGNSSVLKALAVIVLVGLVSFGCLVIYKLWRKEQEDLKTKKSQQIKYGNFYQNYVHETRFFSVGEFYRKIAVGILYIALLESALTQLSVLLVIDVITLITLIKYKPYLFPSVLKMHVAVAAIRIVVVLVGYFLVRSVPLTAQQRSSISMLMLALQLSTLLLLIIAMFLNVMNNVARNLQARTEQTPSGPVVEVISSSKVASSETVLNAPDGGSSEGAASKLLVQSSKPAQADEQAAPVAKASTRKLMVISSQIDS